MANEAPRDAADGEAVNPAQLDLLREGIGETALHRYATAYRFLLTRRLERMERAVAVGDAAQALRITSDLRTSSSMLGAWRFTELLAAADAAVRSGRAAAAFACVERLRAEAEAVSLSLRSLLDQRAQRGCAASDSEPPNR